MPAVRSGKSARVPRDVAPPHLGEIYTSQALDLPGEVWKPVEGYAHMGYEVSSLGRARRHSRGCLRLLTPTIRNQRMGPSGRYLRIDLHDGDGGIRTMSLHKLVALAFLGQPQVPDLQVAHLNGNSLDNRAANLTWATAKENNDHQLLHGTRQFGDNHHNAKVCRYAMLLVHHLIHQEGWSANRVSAVSDLSETSVRRIAAGKLRKIPPEPPR